MFTETCDNHWVQGMDCKVDETIIPIQKTFLDLVFVQKHVALHCHTAISHRKTVGHVACFFVAYRSSCTQESNYRLYLTVGESIWLNIINFYSSTHRLWYGCKWSLNGRKAWWEQKCMRTAAIAHHSQFHLQRNII